MKKSLVRFVQIMTIGFPLIVWEVAVQLWTYSPQETAGFLIMAFICSSIIAAMLRYIHRFK